MVQVVRGRSGMVVSGHHLASFEAANILREGGNAVDAAVAAGAVMAVVCPDACGAGGDVFMLIYDAATRALHGLNGSGRSPAATSRDAFGEEIPLAGIQSASVPGMIAGWSAAVERFGDRDLASLLKPAIAHADEGFPVYPNLARNFALMASSLGADDGARELYMPRGETLRAGEILLQKDLAASLREIAVQGVGALYGGAIAEKIVAYSKRHGGLFAMDDFAAHEPIWQEPIAAPFAGTSVATMPPNSYGITLLLQLAELEAGGIAECEPGGAEMLRRGMQARVQAYADALGVITDPALVEDDARALLDKVLAAHQSAGASSGRPGLPGSAPPGVGGYDTSNVVVMDRQGNCVSLIQSVFHYFGSCVAPSGTGIVLNNRLLGFHLEDGHPNTIGPRKLPAHTLTPVMVLGEDGAPVMACGTPGGPGQTATLSQFLTRVLVFGQEVGEAIAQPRWSVNMHGGFEIEDAMESAVMSELSQHGQPPSVHPYGSQPFGSLMAVRRDGPSMIGSADGRRDASACGW